MGSNSMSRTAECDKASFFRKQVVNSQTTTTTNNNNHSLATKR
jgi:hypothetical protein